MKWYNNNPYYSLNSLWGTLQKLQSTMYFPYHVHYAGRQIIYLKAYDIHGTYLSVQMKRKQMQIVKIMN